MASTKTRAVFLVILAVCAYLTSETDAHLKIGKKEFRPMREELRGLFQDRIHPRFRYNKNQKWKPRIEKIPELYRDDRETLED